MQRCTYNFRLHPQLIKSSYARKRECNIITSSNGKFSTLLALCEGNPPVTGGFPSQRPVMQSFDVFFDLRLNKRLSKQSRRRWFETPSCSLWRCCNETELWYHYNTIIFFSQYSLTILTIVNVQYATYSCKQSESICCVSCITVI